MDRVSNPISTQVERPVDYTREVGETLGGVRPELGPALNADVAPLSSTQSFDLIGVGGRNSEFMRLAAPQAANPFAASPMGPLQDHLMIRKVVSRVGDAVSKQLINVLKYPPKGVSELAISHMQASMAREHKLHQLLKAHLAAVEEIQNRIIGSQEG